MMIDIENEMRENGIIVPLTFNDAGAGNNFASGKGAGDIYGLDSYPQVASVVSLLSSGLMVRLSRDLIALNRRYGVQLWRTIMITI